ncbi:MAG: hypothetical protein NTY00_13255 [Deltaproteobacteria bacterium]|nr:hypothetical protein [Deltaproteobacteria bacterium]
MTREEWELILFAVNHLRMRNVIMLARLVCMLLVLGVLSLSVVYIPDAWSAGDPQTQIAYQQLSFFSEESSLPIEVAVKDPAGVTEVRCYFRFDSSLPFVYSEMVSAKNNVFTTKLPIAIATVQQIEYLFLVVNGQKQAIISPTFTLNKKDIRNGYATGTQNLIQEQYQLKSEVDGADAVKDFFLQPDNISISSVPQQDHYGVLAGLYSKEQLSSDAVPGYFGSFRLDPKNGIIRVKGYIVIRRSSDLSSSQGKSAVAKDGVFPEQGVAPDISGDGWTGFFWRSDDYAGTVVPLTLTVTQNPDGRVTITTSKEGLGHYFTGIIDTTGHMLIYDAYDGEDWSTHIGPATDVWMNIEDYVRPPSLVDRTPPLNIIEVRRSPRPKFPTAAISLLLSGLR